MNCSKCNAPLEGHEAFCPSCGVFISKEQPMQPQETALAEPSGTSNYTSYEIPTMSSPHKTTFTPDTVPPEIKKWNWGAFTFNAFWGIGNYIYLPLLCFIPLFNLVWIFVCGAKGNEWAWKSGKFSNVEDFLATQETWNLAGLVSFLIGLVGFVIYFITLFLITFTSFAPF